MKDMTSIPAKNSTVIWQEAQEDEGMPEPALLIDAFYGTVSITQGDDTILINYQSLETLIKTLRGYAKQAKEGKLE